ncbi:MAG TPA: PilN domain-containing protein [Gammaproteobacteria bacterium]|nr:PilN domain-containing protein [Gammaproteobacteria bacterium]
MARINLLPWRAELRKQRRNEYLAIVGAFAALAVLVWGGVHFHFKERIEFQNERNDYLRREIASLDKKIKEIQELEKEKERLIARMKAIETLQSSRPIIVHIFDELVTSLPEGVYLKEVSQTGTAITLKGVAESNARVSSFMRNIEKSQWLKDPKLEIIQSADESGRRIANFTLRMTQNIPKTETEEGEEAS